MFYIQLKYLQVTFPEHQKVSIMSRDLNSISRDYKRKAATYLNHYQTTNFRLFQTERACRRKLQI